MKRKTIAIFSICLVAAGLAFAHGNKPGKAELSVTGGKIVVDFVGPDLMGRNIDTLIQPGQPWRLGADKPTTLETPVALQFGETRIAPGKYTLRALFDKESKWWLEVVDNNGAVTRLPLARTRARESAQHMIIALEGKPEAASLRVHWGDQLLESKFAVVR